MSREGGSTWRLPLLVLAAGFVGVAWLGLHPKPGQQAVAALFPPWWNLPRAYAAAAAAGGVVLRTGAWPALVITASPEAGFATRLRAAGAWLVLDPQALGTCAAIPERSS